MNNEKQAHHLHQILHTAVQKWRADGYSCEQYPAVAEILQFAIESESGNLRYLRKAQFCALEVYWYLRLKEDTPTIPELYKRLFPKSSDRRIAMGLVQDALDETRAFISAQ